MLSACTGSPRNRKHQEHQEMCNFTHSALRGSKFFFCPRGFHFAAQVSYHTCVSQCQGQAYLSSLLYSRNSILLHISAVLPSSSGTQSILKMERHQLCFTIAREESRLPTTFPKASFSPVAAGGNYCFQFLIKCWKRRRGTQSSPRLLSPSLAIVQASQRS